MKILSKNLYTNIHFPFETSVSYIAGHKCANFNSIVHINHTLYGFKRDQKGKKLSLGLVRAVTHFLYLHSIICFPYYYVFFFISGCVLASLEVPPSICPLLDLLISYEQKAVYPDIKSKCNEKKCYSIGQ